MRVLVTGGAGFIGSHLVDACLRAGHEVGVVDNLSTGKQANLNPEASFFKADIRDFDSLSAIFDQFQPQVVNHHAAQTSVAVAVERPDLDAGVNILGTLNLLKLASEHQVERFVFASSAAVYGEPKRLPLKENDELRPISPYGISKAAGEHYCHYWQRFWGLPTIIWRYANVYGPRQRAGSESGVISIFSQRLWQGKDLKIYGDGCQTRDFVYVGDVVKVNLRLLETKAAKRPLVLNVGTGVETSINDLAKLLMKLTKTNAAIKYLPRRREDIPRSRLDNQRAVESLGWRQTVALEDGLCQLLAATV